MVFIKVQICFVFLVEGKGVERLYYFFEFVRVRKVSSGMMVIVVWILLLYFIVEYIEKGLFYSFKVWFISIRAKFFLESCEVIVVLYKLKFFFESKISREVLELRGSCCKFLQSQSVQIVNKFRFVYGLYFLVFGRFYDQWFGQEFF